jgi:hypothetical protein
MFAPWAEAQGLVRRKQQRSVTMFAKITNTLIAAVVATSATLAMATTVLAGPLPAPTLTEKIWMDRASGSVDGN